MRQNDREANREARELKVFLAFAEHAARRGLRVRPGSVVNRPPPEPDVLCEVDGEGRVAFELVEIVDSGLAENVSLSIRKGVAAAAVCTSDPTLERIRKKVEEKTYTTPHPIELVAWANPFITPPDVWLPTFEPSLRTLHGRSCFRRIWVVNVGGPDDELGVWFVNPPLSQQP